MILAYICRLYDETISLLYSALLARCIVAAQTIVASSSLCTCGYDGNFWVCQIHSPHTHTLNPKCGAFSIYSVPLSSSSWHPHVQPIHTSGRHKSNKYLYSSILRTYIRAALIVMVVVSAECLIKNRTLFMRSIKWKID